MTMPDGGAGLADAFLPFGNTDTLSAMAGWDQDAITAHFQDFLQGNTSLTDASNQFFQVILSGFKSLGDLVQDIITALTGVANGALTDISNFIGTLLGNVTNLFLNAQSLLNGLFDGSTGNTGSSGKTLAEVLQALQTQYSTNAGVGDSVMSALDSVNAMQSALQSQTGDVLTALENAVKSYQILGNRTNKSTSAGADPTSEAMYSRGHFSSGGAVTTTSLTAGNAISQMIRPAESAAKGFIEILANGTGVTNIRVNAFDVDPTTGNKTALWNSGNIASQIPSSLGFVKVLIPGGSQPTVVPGDNLMVEIVNAGTAALTVAVKDTGMPNHPTDFPKNDGATRSIAATGGASPTSLTDAQITYSGVVPYVNLGISDVPADYHAPQSVPFTAAGPDSLVVPAWMDVGDEIDYAGIGAGGGGGCSAGPLTGQGGGCAAWLTGSLVVGTDIALGSTLTINVGAGGVGGNTIGVVSTDGGDTTLTYVDPAGTSHTITFAGGPWGGPGPSHNGANPNGTSNGQGAQDAILDGIKYFGGAPVGSSVRGQSPGGGGGGGSSFVNGNAGGVGALNLYLSQTI